MIGCSLGFGRKTLGKVDRLLLRPRLRSTALGTIGLGSQQDQLVNFSHDTLDRPLKSRFDGTGQGTSCGGCQGIEERHRTVGLGEDLFLSDQHEFDLNPDIVRAKLGITCHGSRILFRHRFSLLLTFI
jgi:hypothetical protein